MSEIDTIEMRTTTIRLDEELARRAKAYAQRQGKTFTDLVAEALQKLIERPETTKRRERIVLPTAGIKNVEKFTDADYRAMVERMYAEDDARILNGMKHK